MGVKLLSLDDDKMLPWRNELFLITLEEEACRQIVILAPELSTSIYVLSQTLLQLGYLTVIACDELQDIALHKILRLTQAGVILITPDELIAELSLTEIAHSEGE